MAKKEAISCMLQEIASFLLILADIKAVFTYLLPNSFLPI